MAEILVNTVMVVVVSFLFALWFMGMFDGDD